MRARVDPAIGEKLYAPLKIAEMLVVLRLAGQNPEHALVGSGLTLRDAFDATTRTSIAQFIRVATNAAHLLDDPRLALRVGMRMRPSCYGLYGYALLCAPTMRAAFDIAVRFHRLATPVLEIRWEQQAERAVWLLPTYAEHAGLDLDRPSYRFFLEMQLTIHASMVRDVMGDGCAPLHARYAEPRPSHAHELERALGCPIEFGAATNELSYPANWLDRAPVFGNPLTAAEVSRSCAKLLEEQRWHAGTTRLVRDALTRIPGRFPPLHVIASGAGVTSRTLARRLEREGTHYRELLDDVRRALAIDYLTTTLLTSEDIAATLGFADASSFRDAFKRWTGQPPTSFRRR